jgi:demethylmenaquinone methyltransferase/2-methoxy-6-polyprenyl-1,4-benzoquinol methylase
MRECRRAAPERTDEYAAVARVYDALVDPFLRGVRKAVAGRIRSFGCQSVLDVACGTGRQLSMLEGNGVRLTGLDASVSMLEVARSKTSPDIDYVYGDAAAMPFADRSFDCVGATFALHEMDDGTRRSVIGEMIRVLASQGVILVVDYAEPEGLSGRAARAAAAVVERAAGARHYGCFRSFMSGGGVPGLAASPGLGAEKMRDFLFGAAGLYEVRVK